MTHTISKETVEEMKQALKPKEPKKLIPFDTADYLDSTEARIEFLRDALEDGDNKEAVVVLLRIAESLGISLLELSLTCLLLTSFETDEVPVTLLEFAKEQLNKKTTEGSAK